MIEHIACVILEGSGALRKKNKTSNKFPSFNTLASLATRHISLHWRTLRTLTMLSKHKTREKLLAQIGKKVFHQIATFILEHANRNRGLSM